MWRDDVAGWIPTPAWLMADVFLVVWGGLVNVYNELWKSLRITVCDYILRSCFPATQKPLRCVCFSDHWSRGKVWLECHGNRRPWLTVHSYSSPAADIVCLCVSVLEREGRERITCLLWYRRGRSGGKDLKTKQRAAVYLLWILLQEQYIYKEVWCLIWYIRYKYEEYSIVVQVCSYCPLHVMKFFSFNRRRILF